MKELNIYRVNDDYVDYLQSIEKEKYGKTRVSNYTDRNYKNKKPYVGIVFEINGYKYFSPLTHPKQHYDQEKQFFNRLSTKIQINESDDLGRIMHCYMIPVPETEFEKVNINRIADNKYKNILMKQYFYIHNLNNQNNIISTAEKLYKKVRNNKTHYLSKFCCDFELLESACDKYRQ